VAPQLAKQDIAGFTFRTFTSFRPLQSTLDKSPVVSWFLMEPQRFRCGEAGQADHEN
jgi:hypothetical protein